MVSKSLAGLFNPQVATSLQPTLLSPTGHAETAHNRIASVVVGFKEALLEEAEKKKDNRK